MRLVIIAACPGTFYALITDFIPSSRYLISFFETQGYARPAPAGLGAWYQQEFAGLDGEDPSTGFYGSLSRAYNPSPGRWLTPDPAGWLAQGETLRLWHRRASIGAGAEMVFNLCG